MKKILLVGVILTIRVAVALKRVPTWDEKFRQFCREETESLDETIEKIRNGEMSLKIN